MINKVITFLVGFVGGCTFGGLYFKSKYEKIADTEIKDMMDWYEAKLNKTEETVEEKKDMEHLLAMDNQFHETLFESCGSKMLEQQLKRNLHLTLY